MIFRTLNKRALEIIVILLKYKTYLLEDFANEFQVSERTIRYDIDKINAVLKKEGLKGIQKEEARYYIDLNEIAAVGKALKKYGDLSSEDRIDYLILKLVSENSVKLAQEAKILGVTRKTLAKDMIEVKERLEREKITVKGLSGIGIKIEGLEYDIRILLGKYLLKLFIKQNILNSTLKNMLINFKNQVDYPSVEKFVRKILKLLKKRVPSYSFHALEAVVIASKIRENFTDESLNDILNDREEKAETLVKMVMVEKTRWDIIKETSNELLNFSLKNSDINLLAKITMETESHFNDYLPIFQESVKSFLEELERRLGKKIELDEKTKDNLCIKLSIGKLKVKYDILERTFSSKELGENYLRLFEIIKEITEKMFGFINDEDLISVTILLKEFISNIDKDLVKKRIIIIDNLHLDQWLGKLFANKLKRLYQIEIVDIIPLYELKNIKIERDLIISLSPLSIKDDKTPFVYINYFDLYKSMDLLENYGLSLNHV
jgi:transcriptional antiterminator